MLAYRVQHPSAPPGTQGLGQAAAGLDIDAFQPLQGGADDVQAGRAGGANPVQHRREPVGGEGGRAVPLERLPILGVEADGRSYTVHRMAPPPRPEASQWD